MNAAAPPVLTVRANGAEHIFTAGHDVIVGSDLRADVCVAHPLISRRHLLLRFGNGRWRAIDSSRQGTFVARRRARVIDICDGQRVNVGTPDGPCLTFGVGWSSGGAAPPAAPLPGMLQASSTNQLPDPPTVPQFLLPAPPSRPAPSPQLVPADDYCATIGRAGDNDIVVPDVLASRHHAFLVPTHRGTEIRDSRSVNGTFVNGVRVGSATLTRGDVVTVGNVDLQFTGDTLVPQTAAGTGGLEGSTASTSIPTAQNCSTTFR